VARVVHTIVLRATAKAVAATVTEVRALADIVFVLIAVAFFALCVAYVRGLDRLVRASEEGEAAQEATS
jgi:hypothetical protein